MPIHLQREPAMWGVTPVDNLFLSQYMPMAPGDYVKVYLFGLMELHALSERFDMEAALSMDAAAILEAYRYWEALGLVRIIPGAEAVVEYRCLAPLSAIPQMQEHKYAALNRELQKFLGGHALSQREYGKIYDWMEIFGMEEAVVLMLVAHCVETRGSKVSVNYMDAVARSWAEKGILHTEAAEDYLKGQTDCMEGARKVLKRFGLSRRPTADELALYDKWCRDWGFDEESILSACVETTSSMRPSFKYLDAILESCRMQGLKGPMAVENYLKGRDALAELSRLVLERAGIRKSPTAAQQEQIGVWSGQWHLPNEVILFGAECAVGESSPFTQLRKRMEHWHKLGVKDLGEAREAYGREAALGGGRRDPMGALNYSQRKYSEEDIKKMGILSFDEDEV